jgi:hypothetical protein
VKAGTKATAMAKLLVQAQIPYKIHIVKDHDMKERLCHALRCTGIREIEIEIEMRE